MNSRLLLALAQLMTAVLLGGPWLYHRYRPAARWARELSNTGYQQPVFALFCLVLAALTLLGAFLGLTASHSSPWLPEGYVE